MTGNRRVVLMSLLGAAIGFLVLHPYTMMVYELHEDYGAKGVRPGAARLLSGVVASFQPDMLAMGIPFALLGGGAGRFFGFWLNARVRRLEAEKRLLAAETVRQLTVTLAHHLLNAAQGIGVISAAVMRKERDEETRRRLELIRDEARRIEAVVKSLQSLETVATVRYVESCETLMIDIREELRKALTGMEPGRKP